MAERTVKVVVQASVDQYKRDMAAAGAATEKASRAGTKGFHDQSTVMDRASRSAMLMDQRMVAIRKTSTVAGAAILGGLAVGLVKSTHAASDLNETVNKSNVIFGASSQMMQQWGEGAAKALGLSKREALESAASFGDMFAQLGWGQQEAANMSQSVVKLAADLGSFNNLPTAEVTQMIAAGFRGEYDSLQRLIPNINAARVQTEALAATGKSNAASLTAQEKAAATLAIIQKDGARAQDDFARTSGEAANAQKIAAAEFENAQAKLGENLTPALATAANAASSLLSAFNALPGPVRTSAVVIAAAAGAFLVLAPRIAAVRAMLAAKTAATVTDTAMTRAHTAATFQNVGASSIASIGTHRFSGALSQGAKGLAGWPGLLAIAGTATSKWAADASNAADELSNLEKSGMFAMAALNPLMHLGMGGKFLPGAKSEIVDVGDAMRAAGVTAEELQAALNDEAGAVELVEAKMAAVPAAAGAMDAANKSAAKGIQSVADAAKAANGDVDEFAKKLEALIAPGLAASKAADASTEAIRKVAAAARENGGALSGNSEAALANREALRSAVQANLDLAVTTARSTGSTEKGAAAYNRASTALAAAAVKAGYSKREVDAFMRSMNATANMTVKPRVTVSIAAAQQHLKVAQRELNSLRQSRRPGVAANIGPLQLALRQAEHKMNTMRQSQSRKPIPRVDQAKAFEDVRKIQWVIDQLKGGNVTIDINRVIRTTTETVAVKKAAGGFVRGPGTSTSDSIPAMLSDGEYVVRADAVDHYGIDKLNAINSRSLPRFAAGGVVRIRDQKKFDAANRRWQDYQEAIKSRNQRSAQTKASFLSSAFAEFDFGAYESRRNDTVNAIRDEIQAQKDLADARRKALTAKGSEKASAIKELADAQQKYADAKKATADATRAEEAAKPTAKNIIASAQAQIARMTTFANDLSTLGGWGVPKFLISDMLGRPEGPEMARALVGAGRGALGGLTSAASSANSAAARLAQIDIAVSSPDAGGATFTQIVAQKQKAQAKRPVLVKPRKVKKRALGGPVQANEPVLAGETGPELFWPGMSGHMVSAAQTHTMLSGGGATVHHATGSLTLRIDSKNVWEGVIDYHSRTGFTARGAKVLK